MFEEIVRKKNEKLKAPRPRFWIEKSRGMVWALNLIEQSLCRDPHNPKSVALPLNEATSVPNDPNK